MHRLEVKKLPHQLLIEPDNMHSTSDNRNISNIESAIQVIHEYANVPNIIPLISILELLMHDINNESLLEQLADAWRNLGVYQGTVLTYLPFFTR